MAEQEEDFAALLDEFEQKSTARRAAVKVGDIVSGPVVSIGTEAVFIELGTKSEAILDREQVLDADGQITVQVGDVVEARVVDAGGKGGSILLRRSATGSGPNASAELAQAFEHQLPVDGTVMGTNKGGLDIQIAGVRAFCPVSQLEMRFVEDPESYVGRKLSFRITRLEPGRGSQLNLVVSRRALLEEEAAVLAAETRAKLHRGAVMRGVVTTIKPYGAFVDIGGLEGMLHISELGFSRVADPSEVLTVGQTIEVQVIKIEETGDANRPEKIGLSLKSMERDPWEDAASGFKSGSRVKGKIARLQDFGAFVELAPGIEGLVHISELGAERHINHPRDVVKLGQEVEVGVLKVDLEARRISLSMAKLDEAVDLESYQPSGNAGLGTFADLLKG